MTDREMLLLCLDAFKAIPRAGDARKQLKRMQIESVAYAGNRSHILASEMVKRLNDYLMVTAPEVM